MRYAILSDIHANPSALKSVLKDIQRQKTDKIVCLGDVVGYGPDAESAIRIVREKVDVCIMGNHDAAVAGKITGEGFSLNALRGVKRHRDETSEKSRVWLGNLPYLYEGDGFVCAHGEFSAPEKFNYIMTPLDALASWSARKEQVMFIGHTHVPSIFALSPTSAPSVFPTGEGLVLQDGWRYIVNVGSAGYPRHEPKVSYCVYDTKARTIDIRRLPFDFNEYEREMLKRNVELPSWFERLKNSEG